jgi:poly(glycerol-phosphate) alpha-glucosyltransferase
MPPSTELPTGRYLSCALQVPPDGGGQTRALLIRNRILAGAGLRPDVVTLGPAPDHDRRRELLRERGLLPEPLGLLNIYEHYREHGWGDAAGTGEALPDLSAHRVAEEERAGGLPWRVTYEVPGQSRAVYDYLRDDGTPYLRIPAFGLTNGSSGRGAIRLVGRDGEILEELRSAGQWFRRWIRTLVEGHDRSFVFTDSRFVAPHLARLAAPHVHVVYVMHNVHLEQPSFRWDGSTNRAYTRVLERAAGFDALVNLTARQSEDIAQRRGRTSNLFVVPNPIERLPAPPPRAVRDPLRVAVVARLEPQKRLVDAIAAFALVVEAVPEAHLDVYGDGSAREHLQAEIDRRGLAGSVTLHGWNPRASDALWTASAFLLTSLFEGYPLSTLESMARGCPVVAYDIKYGPREQISDGVDGHLVPEGDVEALAARVVELLRSRERAAAMSAAARAAAAHFGPEEFVAAWAAVLREVVALRPLRTTLESVELELTRADRRRLEGTLRVTARSRKATLDSAAVELDVVDTVTGAVAPQRVKLEVAGADELRFRAKIRPPGETERLRLRLLWQNSAWEADPFASP